MTITVGLTGLYTKTVTTGETAHAFGNDGVHVLASPTLGLYCELACHNAIEPHFAPGESSVGIHLDLYHMAATAAGDQVTVEARLTEIDRKRVVFTFEGHDSRGQIVRGVHERMLVDLQKFLENLPQPKNA